MIIQSTNVYYQEKLLPLQVEITGNKITAIMPYGVEKVDVDYGDNWILPGLIDIHNHGYKGLDANHATKEWVKEWMAYLPTEGVTSTLPATSSAPHQCVLSGMRAIAEAFEEEYKGANILGIYSEGPFMSEKYRGAQDLANKIVPTRAIIDEYLEASKGLLEYVMVAPEELPDMDVIKYCVSKGLKVAIGHSGADFAKCTEARNAGARAFTHTYNGMRGLHHREPGTLGAAMYYDDMYAELIGDGVHVSFPSASILARIKGKDKLISITDSVAIKGLPVGDIMLRDSGVKVRICEDGVGRLENGTIAGSCNRLNTILKREIENAGIDVVTAINSCTANPACLLGYDYCKGYIKENYDADIVVLDRQFEPVQTYVMGEGML
jgi:N-acetylglucosamine-6-phosphate deacetylase